MQRRVVIGSGVIALALCQRIGALATIILAS
jgi:hypothetical protein